MEDTENNYQKYKFTETLTQQFSSGNFQQISIPGICWDTKAVYLLDLILFPPH